MPISSIWKRDCVFLGLWYLLFQTEFPCFFWACDGNLIWKRDNANIFYLKTGFPIFWACDGNLWKIMPISSIWKRDFRCFFLACDANIFYLKTGFPLFFLACDGNLWKIISISSIWKRNFRVFSGLVMGTSFENGISVSFWAFLENNANIFFLKTGFPSLFLACDGNLWKIIPISSIWKRDFVFLGLWWNLWKIMPISSFWERDFRCFFLACDGTSGK